MVQMAYICVPLVCSFGTPLMVNTIPISQRVLQWSKKISTLCIVAVAYIRQVYFVVTFLKKKKKGQPSGSSDRSISLWTNYRGMP